MVVLHLRTPWKVALHSVLDFRTGVLNTDQSVIVETASTQIQSSRKTRLAAVLLVRRTPLKNAAVLTS
jgi:hypothetical protein